MSAAREEILRRVREALDGRPPDDHPGAFPGGRRDEGEARPPPAVGAREAGPGSPLERFEEAFTAVGGEVVVFSSLDEARAWLEELVGGLGSVVAGATVPSSLRPGETGEPGGDTELHTAEVGISMARSAVAETGSLVLDARDGRGVQLLPRIHVVWLRADTVHETLLDMLREVGGTPLPSAVALHSGPSKSADIGQIMVRGVHGPGRIVAAVLAVPPHPPSP